VIASLVLLGACGSSSPHPTTTATTSPPPRVTTTSPRPSTATTPAPSQQATGDQLIVVDAAAYGQSTATLTAYEQTATGWVRRFGPWAASIGRNGFAPPGEKREGDGRAPSGTYGFEFFFGIQPNPGVAFPYRRIGSTALVWDDDPNSANYNEWVDTRVAAAGVRPEPMHDAPFYDYGAVIAYNTERTPGLGSAIFLHVSNGDSTAGCVALPVSELLQVLRWLTPTRNPHVRMGVNAPPP
jgi:L,D-peptidoglycan transpeptidase YkuD (ErfK/YbiS/YcfS/YnhG family)